jgi:hypothetical protein
MKKFYILKSLFFSIIGLATGTLVLSGGATQTNNGECFGVAKNDVMNNGRTSEVLRVSSLDSSTETNEVLFKIRNINTTSTSASVSFNVTLNDSVTNSYYIGYDNGTLKPAVLVYKVKKSNNVTEERETKITKYNTNQVYDGLGETGDSQLQTSCDIVLTPDETLLTDEISLKNIYLGQKVDGVWSVVPDTSYYVTGTKIATYREFKSNQFVEFTYKGYSTFTGYTSLAFDVSNLVDTDLYISTSSTIKRIYNTNIESVEAGTKWIRTRLYFGADTSYIYTLNDGTVVTVPNNDGVDTIDVTKGKSVEFLMNNEYTIDGVTYNLNGNNIKDFALSNFYVYTDLYDSLIFKGVTQSNYSARFNNLPSRMNDVLDSNGDVVEGYEKVAPQYTISADLIYVLVTVILTLVYAGADIAAYFILKKKYINNEFKRVRTKPYVRTSIMGYLAIMSITLSVMSIVFRSTILNGTFAVFNPVDILIVIFSVMGIILFGYFVRYFFVQIKSNVEKKRNDKLNKEGNNSIDDGTLQIPSSSK